MMPGKCSEITAQSIVRQAVKVKKEVYKYGLKVIMRRKPLVASSQEMVLRVRWRMGVRGGCN